MCECSKLDHVANLLQYLAVVIKSSNVSSSDVDDIRRIIEHVAVELGRVAERLEGLGGRDAHRGGAVVERGLQREPGALRAEPPQRLGGASEARRRRRREVSWRGS